MKFTINNSYNLSLGAKAQTKNTKGLKLWDKLFGKTKEKDDSKIESIDHDDAFGTFELIGNIEVSAEISTDEFSELIKVNRENSILNREELSWFYNGCRKAIANLAEDIKKYGKDISNACWDVSDEFEARDHQQDLKRSEQESELEIKRFKMNAETESQKNEIRKQYSNEDSKKD